MGGWGGGVGRAGGYWYEYLFEFPKKILRAWLRRSAHPKLCDVRFPREPSETAALSDTKKLTMRPIIKPTIKPIIKSIIKPMRKPIIDSIRKPTVKPMRKPSIKPMRKPTIKLMRTPMRKKQV